MECAAIADCVYWLVRPRPDMQCVIKSEKGTFVADARHVHGDRDELCAKPTCSAAAAAKNMTTLGIMLHLIPHEHAQWHTYRH
jgi:hypothetical protein